MNQSKHLVALCVGHSRLIKGRPEGGAVSVSGVQEWAYNCALAVDIEAELKKLGIASMIVKTYKGEGYTAAQTWLAEHLKSSKATLAIELHFNSADDPAATGHEWLYWEGSSKGFRLAAAIDTSYGRTFPDLKARGIKPKGQGARGAEFLKLTHCPAVIAEPFFGSNLRDWQHADSAQALIAHAIAAGIAAYLKAL